MNIIEVKNNLVKLCYENDLKLSELIKISDTNKTFIAQVIHLEATRIGKTAIAKIIFNYNNGISAYDGSIPSLKSVIETLSTDVLLKIIDKENPLNLGRIAQQESNLIVNADILNDNPIICAEKYFTTKVLLNNIAMQLQARKSKIVVFDTIGVFKNNKVTLTKDFRIPLNSSTINYIYEKGFEDATAESKALIQSIFEELSEYSKTVEYIPFDTFKAVIDAEFKRTQLMQLIILKNKIKQIRDWSVFAEQEEDYKVLKTKLADNQITVVDISVVKDELQKECIKYIYKVLNSLNEEIYVFTPLTNFNSDKPLLQIINDSEKLHTTTICGYDYKYMQELKQRSKNMLMFTPLKQQQDFGGYNIFLKKLAEDEFIAYGKMTKFVPLIAKLHPLSTSEIYVPKEVAEAKPEPEQKVPEVVTEEPKEAAAEVIEPVELQEEPVETEAAQPTADEPTQTAEAPTEEVPTAEEDATAAAEDDSLIEEIAESAPENVTAEESVPTAGVPTAEEELPTVEEALSEVPETEEEEELSDDDLDMIEKLSKPDEEIEVLNQEVPQEVTPQPVAEPMPSAEPPVTGPEVEPEAKPVAAEEMPTPQAPPQEVAEEPIPQAPVEEVEEKKTENEVAAKENGVDEEISQAAMPQNDEGIQTRTNKSPIVPEYSSAIPDEDKINDEKYKEGDRVMHQEFGEGVVEKMINYGDKILCSINFSSVGRRLLNPEITEMRKI